MNKEKLRYYYLKFKYQYIRISRLARFKINEIRQKIEDGNFKKPQQFKNIKLNKKYFFIGTMVLVVLMALLVGRQFSPGSSLGSIGGDDRLDPPKAIATQELKSEGCDYIEWINGTTEKLDEDCPECGKKLVLFTTNAGKRMKKCSTAGWDKDARKATGCTYVEWLKPDYKKTESDSGGEEFLPPEPQEKTDGKEVEV